MVEKNEKKTASSKVNNFLEKYRKIILGLFIFLVVAVLGFICVSFINSSATQKNLAAVEEISFELTDMSATLEESELASRRTEIKEKISAYTNKGGIAGVRANMLLAEVAFQEKNFQEALDAWKKVISKGKKSYTAPLAYFNIGVCYEELGNLDEALKNYKTAYEANDFVLKNHAKFSYARVLETKGDFQTAYNAYKELYDNNPDDSWAKLAKSRMISLEIENKVE